MHHLRRLAPALAALILAPIATAQDADPLCAGLTRIVAAEAWTKLAARTRACLTPAGWTVSGGERIRAYEDYTTELVFTRPGSVNDIAVTLKEDNSSPSARSSSTYWFVSISVRNPNPTHPKQS